MRLARYLSTLMVLAACSLVACSDDTSPAGQRPGDASVDSDASAPQTPCAEDLDCPLGQDCVGGFCGAPTSTVTDDGCWTDDDCDEGYLCAESTGRCVPEASVDRPIVDTSDCVDGETRRCGMKAGECDYGTERCENGAWTGVCEDAVGPSPEKCDDLDNNCDGTVDEGCDDDGDAYCDATLELVGTPAVCPRTTGPALTDCDDTDRAIHPGANDICDDNIDQDCSGAADEGCGPCSTGVDNDFDGADQCLDCNDADGSIFPGANELCDGADNDCDGTIDEGFDGDSDTYTTCGTVPGGGLDPSLIDCNDSDPNSYPGACELCALGAGNTVACGASNDRGNGVDENCNGFTDETCMPCTTTDADNDGVSECDGDCDDSNPNVSPNLPEACDGLDTDCNAFTTENCAVGDTCNWPGDPDICEDELICVESLGPSGNGTGNFTCTSYCNTSFLGNGLGDGCQPGQTCNAILTPTANIHGCGIDQGAGTGDHGASCGSDTDCRSGDCTDDPRTIGPPDRFCRDLCGSDAYCNGGTTCQAWGIYTGECYPTLSLQTQDVNESCEGSFSAVNCLAGNLMCVEFVAGTSVCTKPCCTNPDCPSGYFCSLKGNDTPGPAGGYDTLPVCWPEGAGSHNRQAGAACTSNGDCAGEFCDQTLNICVDVCCDDSTCPAGLTCELNRVTKADGHQTFVRVCTNLTPSAPLQAMP